MCSACSTHHHGARPLEALLGDVAMSAFDFARSDGQSFGQGLSIVQLGVAGAEIAMAGSHGGVLVIDLGGLAMSGERLQDGGRERPLLSASFCVSIQRLRATGSGATAAAAAARYSQTW